MEGDNPDLALAASGIVDSLNIVQSDMTAKVIRDCGKKSIDADIAKTGLINIVRAHIACSKQSVRWKIRND